MIPFLFLQQSVDNFFIEVICLEIRPELKIHAYFWVIIAFLGREAPQKQTIYTQNRLNLSSGLSSLSNISKIRETTGFTGFS
jgi:hypothetical protein